MFDGDRITILLYHSVREQPDPLNSGVMDVATFRDQLHQLSKWFNVLPLGHAVKRWHNGSLPRRTACITFDDGYRDNLQIACPALLDAGLQATFFVATGYLEGGCMWNDRVTESIRRTDSQSLNLQHLDLGIHSCETTQDKRKLLKLIIARLKYLTPKERSKVVENLVQLTGLGEVNDIMMSPAEVRQLHRAGMEIGAHTVNHPILTQISQTDAFTEIADSKSKLESILGEPVRLFAYPNGGPGKDYDANHVSMVKKIGFESAVTTSEGNAKLGGDLLQLARFRPGRHRDVRFSMRLFKDGLLRRPEAV